MKRRRKDARRMTALWESTVRRLERLMSPRETYGAAVDRAVEALEAQRKGK